LFNFVVWILNLAIMISQTNFDITVQLKSLILTFFPNSNVILFGSRARKDNTIESDYDLLIITTEKLSVSVKRDFKTKIRKALFKLNILSDILIESDSEVQIKMNLPGHIVRNAMNEGVRL